MRDQFFPGYSADSASAGVRASWTFFTGGRNSARIRKADADIRAAEADAAAMAQQVQGRAIESFTALQSAQAQLSAAERARQRAKRPCAARGWKSRSAPASLALLDAEREAIAAGTARISAAGQVLVAAHVLRAIAGLVDRP